MIDLDLNASQTAKLLGENLRKRRKAVFPDDTQAQMAARLGIGVATYGRMERGDVTVSLKHYLVAAEILNCTRQASELFAQGDHHQGGLIEKLLKDDHDNP